MQKKKMHGITYTWDIAQAGVERDHNIAQSTSGDPSIFA